MMVMTRIEWKRVSLLVAVVAALAALTFAIPDASVGAEPQSGGRGTAAIPTEPLYLPNHHYDLPATHVTAAQIQAHKAKMLADKDEDVPLNMVKSGGTGDKHQVGISVVYRLKGQSNPTYAVHDDVGEVYHVLEGAGTMLLGGKLKDGKRRPTSVGNGMGSVGTNVGWREASPYCQGRYAHHPRRHAPPLDDGRRVHELHGRPHRC